MQHVMACGQVMHARSGRVTPHSGTASGTHMHPVESWVEAGIALDARSF